MIFKKLSSMDFWENRSSAVFQVAQLNHASKEISFSEHLK